MPIAATGHLTARMAETLNASLPGNGMASRNLFLGGLLHAIENRAVLTGPAAAKADAWGRRGDFRQIHDALLPHQQQFDANESSALWTLKGLGEVYATDAPADFQAATRALDLWMVSNPQRIDDLQADLFREIGYLDDARFAAGWCRPEKRMAMAGHLAQVCRQNGMDTAPSVDLVPTMETGEKVIVLSHKDRPDRPIAVWPRDLLRVASGASTA